MQKRANTRIIRTLFRIEPVSLKGKRMALQKKNVKCAREVAILAPYAAKCCVRDDISNMPSFTACIEYALERVESYEEQYGKINFLRAYGHAARRIRVPASFDGTARYEASLFGSEALFLSSSFSRRARKARFPGRAHGV